MVVKQFLGFAGTRNTRIRQGCRVSRRPFVLSTKCFSVQKFADLDWLHCFVCPRVTCNVSENLNYPKTIYTTHRGIIYMMYEVTAESVEETQKVAKDLFVNLKKRPEQATVIALTGSLGTGKTEFVRGLLYSAGVDGSVTSPTYTIETIYMLPTGPFSRGYHIDAYRLEGEADLKDLNFLDRLTDPENLIMVEWAKQVSGVIPDHAIHVDVSFGNQEGERLIQISNE